MESQEALPLPTEIFQLIFKLVENKQNLTLIATANKKIMTIISSMNMKKVAFCLPYYPPKVIAQKEKCDLNRYKDKYIFNVLGYEGKIIGYTQWNKKKFWSCHLFLDGTKWANYSNSISTGYFDTAHYKDGVCFVDRRCTNRAAVSIERRITTLISYKKSDLMSRYGSSYKMISDICITCLKKGKLSWIQFSEDMEEDIYIPRETAISQIIFMADLCMYFE